MATPRVAPGGASTVCLGNDESSWDTDSRAHGRGSAEAVASATPTPRCAVGGHDSIQFGASDDAVRPATGRQPCGGASTVFLGSDALEWTTNSSAHGIGGAEAVASAELRVRQAVGGKDSISFGSEAAAAGASTTPRSARVATGGPTTISLGSDKSEWKTNSSAHGAGCAEATSSASPSARVAPGGLDSIDFGHTPHQLTAEELRARRPADGHSTVVLGTDAGRWGTNSSAHGVGSMEAVASATPRERTAPGGLDSIDFSKQAALASKEELLTRAAPGGTDSISHLADTDGPGASAEELFARRAVGGKDSIEFGASAAASDADRAACPPVAGKTSVVLGMDPSEWDTSSSSHGVGSAEAVASAEPRVRQACGGTDSIKFGQDDGKALSAEVLRERRENGAGPSSVVLGCDKTEWFTNSSINGAGSAEAVAAAEPRVRTAPGGADTVDFGNANIVTASAEELLARPAVGGADHLDFASQGDSGLPAQELLMRPSVAGLASVVLGADGADWKTDSQAVGVGSAEAITSARGAADAWVRPPIGGADSVSLGGAPPPACKPAFTHPTGAATIVLGADPAEWSVDSKTLGAGSAEAVAAAELRPRTAPGGTDSIDFAKDHGSIANTLSAQELRARPSPGGADCIDLTSSDQGPYSARTQTSRAGPHSTMLKPSSRVHHAPGGASTLILGTYSDPEQARRTPTPKAPEPVAEAPRSVRQAPGGTSSFSLTHDEGAAQENVSSSRFANGSNQNAGNCITGRSSTRLHHAPGGYSSLSLAHADSAGEKERASGPAVLGETLRPVSSNAFADGRNQNAGNVLTARSSTRLHQAPGGTSSICLGDENVDSSNIFMSTDKEPAKLAAPEVQAAGARPIMVLG
jgi:hypothetical protein